MPEKRYRISYSGQIIQGHDREQVKRNLARFYKLDPARSEHLFSGKPVVIKQNADYELASRYKKVFETAGAICMIDELETGIAPPRPSAGIRKKEPPPPKPAEIMTCPKCDHEQEKADQCSRCGIVIEKYLKREADRQDDQDTDTAAPYYAPKAIPPSSSESVFSGTNIVLLLVALFLVPGVLLMKSVYGIPGLGIPAGDQAGWQEFSPANGGFAVLMPGRPSDVTSKLPGSSKTHNACLFALPGLVTYMVTYMDFGPADMEGLDYPEGVFDALQESLLQSKKWHRLVSKERITLDGHPGREIIAEGSVKGPGDAIIRARLFLAQKRLFMIYAVKQKDRESVEDEMKFLDSFHLTP